MVLNAMLLDRGSGVNRKQAKIIINLKPGVTEHRMSRPHVKAGRERNQLLEYLYTHVIALPSAWSSQPKYGEETRARWLKAIKMRCQTLKIGGPSGLVENNRRPVSNVVTTST